MASSIISIDWLQLYVDLTHLEYVEEFKVKKLAYGTKHFITIEEIFLQGSLFCTIEREPRSEVLKSHTGIIKFENSLLYRQDAETVISNFLNINNIHPLSITRIDIAVDFKKFKNGLLPQNLIRGFMKEKYLRNGRGKYTIIGNQRNVSDVSYLRFGTRASDVSVILYNKTLEMKEKVYKPHIAKQWKALRGSPMADVWRLEFSIKGKATTFLNEDTGEIEEITLNTLSNDTQKRILVSALEKRYFEFKINDGQKNKTRMKRLTLLDLKETEFTNRYMPAGSDIYKRDKMFLKRLFVLDKEERNIPEYALQARNDLLDFMTKNEYLEKYLEDKKPYWNETTFKQ